MSLILDALRKADAERERGSVPGLHSQPGPVLIEESPKGQRAAIRWAGAGIAAGLAIAVGIAFFGRQTPDTVGASAIPAAPVALRPPLAAPTAQSPVAQPAVVPPAVAQAPVVQAPVAQQPAAQPAAQPPVAPAATQLQSAKPAAWPPENVSRPAVPGAAADVRPAATPSVPAGEPAIESREQLPAQVRSELPVIAVNGVIFSPNPADRSLLIGGRLFRENDALAPDLSIEQIRQKSVVVRFRGHRVDIPF